MVAYQNWQLGVEGHVATLTLNRPDTANNISPETLYELREVTAYLGDRRDVWAVIVEGRGQHFSTGVDLGVIREWIGKPEGEIRDFLTGLQSCLDDFVALEKPTIAKVRGFCIAGGLFLALSCDFRIASQRTVFSLPEVQLGLAGAWGVQRVTRIVGVPAAKEMLMLGKRYKAREAAAMGLVHQVVPPDKLDAAVASLAQRFETLPPRTVGIAKRIIDQGYAMSLRESEDLETDAHVELLGSPDLKEAVASYVEKRRPRFTGE